MANEKPIRKTPHGKLAAGAQSRSVAVQMKFTADVAERLDRYALSIGQSRSMTAAILVGEGLISKEAQVKMFAEMPVQLAEQFERMAKEAETK